MTGSRWQNHGSRSCFSSWFWPHDSVSLSWLFVPRPDPLECAAQGLAIPFWETAVLGQRGGGFSFFSGRGSRIAKSSETFGLSSRGFPGRLARELLGGACSLGRGRGPGTAPTLRRTGMAASTFRFRSLPPHKTPLACSPAKRRMAPGACRILSAGGFIPNEHL